jgi:hypothetical protein
MSQATTAMNHYKSACICTVVGSAMRGDMCAGDLSFNIDSCQLFSTSRPLNMGMILSEVYPVIRVRMPANSSVGCVRAVAKNEKGSRAMSYTGR